MKDKNPLSLIEGDLCQLEQRLLSAIRSDAGAADGICRYLLQAGGKRLRPALCFMGAYRGSNYEQVMKVATAIELTHMATLVHDDVIDQASTRRGVPTVNMRWGAHRAVLSGDFLFARAFSLIAAEGLTDVISNLSEVVSLLCEGELLQEQDLFDCEQTEERYLDRISKKTANFIAASCQLGALTAGFPVERALLLRQYGYALGMAFQITDDILDITATSRQLGKPVGGDLKQGNLTLPVIHALRNSPQSCDLRERVAARPSTEAELQQCLQLVRAGDSVDYSYKRAAQFIQEARECLPADLDAELHAALTAVAEFIGLRKS
ncbi:MAG: polyprenyl synthetase family protein [Sporomusaceae bacterium]|nr:polyprenyl synthetase family protein [Sporomusaceae bacterium]